MNAIDTTAVLSEVIATARDARAAVVDGTMPPKTANAIAAQNHAITTAVGLDLRTRIFDAEMRAMESHARDRLPAAAE